MDERREDEGRSGTQVEPVVVGVDGSESSKEALTWAAHWARLSGGPLLAVAVWHLPKDASWGWGPPWPENYDPQSEAKQTLDEVVKEVLGSHPDVDLRTEVVQGHPSPVLTEMSKSASLIVVGSRGHGEFAGMLLGSVSEFVITHAHCPVVVIRDR